MDRGGIPANNFWPFVGDSNGLGKGVSVLERMHSNSAYEVLISIFISSLFAFLLTLIGPGMQAGCSRPHFDGTADCIRSCWPCQRRVHHRPVRSSHCQGTYGT